MNIAKTNEALLAYTRRTLLVSTAQIPNSTAEVLRWLPSTLNAMTCEGGWIFSISEVAWEHPAAVHEQPVLLRLLKFAYSYGFDYLQLDADGDRLPFEFNFPVFEW